MLKQAAAATGQAKVDWATASVNHRVIQAWKPEFSRQEKRRKRGCWRGAVCLSARYGRGQRFRRHRFRDDRKVLAVRTTSRTPAIGTDAIHIQAVVGHLVTDALRDHPLTLLNRLVDKLVHTAAFYADDVIVVSALA